MRSYKMLVRVWDLIDKQREVPYQNQAAVAEAGSSGPNNEREMELGKLGFDAVVHDVSAPTLYISEMKNDTKTCLCAHWSMTDFWAVFMTFLLYHVSANRLHVSFLGHGRGTNQTQHLSITQWKCANRGIQKKNEFRTQKLTNGSIHPHEHTWFTSAIIESSGLPGQAFVNNQLRINLQQRRWSLHRDSWLHRWQSVFQPDVMWGPVRCFHVVSWRKI